jgi:hypothetical protein
MPARYNTFDAAYTTETTMENGNIKGFAGMNSRPLVLNRRLSFLSQEEH